MASRERDPGLLQLMRAAPFVAALAVCACAAPGGLAPVAEPALQAHVRFLADDALQGRMTGTAGYDIAAQYVESQFRQLGLAPAGTEGYRQPVPYAAATIEAKASAVRIHGASGSRSLRWRDDWIAGGDVLRQRTQVRAKAVFVGYGVQAPEQGYDDYAGIDVRGRIVVRMDGAPKRFDANRRAYYSSGAVKNAAAVAAGAVGVVEIRNAYDIEHYSWERVARNAGKVPSMRWVSADGKAADYFPELRGAVTLSEPAAARVLGKARHAELLAADGAGADLPRFALPVEIELSRSSQVSRTQASNVIGLLRGADPDVAHEYVVYTAHLDHIGVGAEVDGDAVYNGMYDNAMGVAVLLETARMLAAARPRRSILFVAVGGEERGLLGSDYFAHYPTVPAGALKANINLDMPLFLFPLADVVAFGAEHSTLATAVASAAEAEGLALAPDPLPDEVIFIRSDQYSLVKQGVPAVFLVPGFTSADPALDGAKLWHEFLGTHYHRPSDDLSRPVHWPSALRFTRVNARIGLQVANAATAPAWHAGNFFGERFARR